LRYLAEDSSRPPSATLVPLLLQNECPVRARAAAELLTRAEGLSPQCRVRVGLLANEAVATPINQDTSAAWLAELQGPFRPEALDNLETQQFPAWLELVRNWKGLPADDQIWLLQWGVREFPESIGTVLEASLRSTDTPLLKAALEALSDGTIAELYGSLLPLASQQIHHPDAQIRYAAAVANPPGVDWRGMLAHEEDAFVRQACLVALRKCEGEKALPELVNALRDQDWRTRAVAAAELVQLGQSAAPAVQPLLSDSQDYVRIAAMRILAEFE
jgi:hypothetical protein